MATPTILQAVVVAQSIKTLKKYVAVSLPSVIMINFLVKFTFFFVILVTVHAHDDSNTKIILDNDAGGDDAMAIFLALLNEKYFNGAKLVGLTTCNGNTNEDNVCTNNQRILKAVKRQDVPIYRGSKESLVTTPPVTDYFGKDGLGDCGLYKTDLLPADKLGGVSALIELSKKHEGNLTVVTLGSLTNIALAIKMDPDFLSRLQQLYVAAGNIHNDDHPSPEFNAQMDVEAYNIIAQHATPDKVTLLPFSQVKTYLNLSLSWRLDVLGQLDTEIMRAQNLFEKVPMKWSDRWLALDPAAVAVAVKPDLVKEYKYSKNGIITCGDKRGMNTNQFVDKKDANVRIIHSIKEEEYKTFLLEVFSKPA